MKKYGVEYPPQSEGVKGKAKKTCLERYGVRYPIQNEEVKERMKQTCLRNMGIEIQCNLQDIFQKFIASSFRKKPFVVAGVLHNLMGFDRRTLLI